MPNLFPLKSYNEINEMNQAVNPVENIFKYHVFTPLSRFQLELIYLIFTIFPYNSRLFLSCRPFVVVTTFSTIPVENVVITTKGLQDRNNLLLDGRMVQNKGKLILTVENKTRNNLDDY